MAPPLSFDRVLNALRRFWPKWPALDAYGVWEEAQAIATVVGRVVDRFDAMKAELFPDSAVETLDRLEAIWRIATRPTDSTATRQARVAAAVGRINGSTPAQLRELLAPAFAFVNPNDVVLVEMLRADVEKAMTAREEYGGAAGIFVADGQSLLWHVPAAWPGKVDDVGVALAIDYDCPATIDGTVTHGDGTSWTVTFDDQNVRAVNKKRKRATFVGKRAAGPWTVRVDVNGGDPARIYAVELMVSNDEDSRQIFHFYAARDPNLAGTGDFVEGQRLFATTAHAHYRSRVCERTTVIVNDSRSLCDRDVIGS
jgi:hypothetical protein